MTLTQIKTALCTETDPIVRASLNHQRDVAIRVAQRGVNRQETVLSIMTGNSQPWLAGQWEA